MGAVTSTRNSFGCRLIVRLPAVNLLPGFRADEWTILEDFGDEVEALAGTRRIGRLLARLEAEGAVVKEVAAVRPAEGAAWTIIRRFGSTVVAVDPAAAVAAEAEARVSWNRALAASSGSLRPKPGSRRPAVGTALGLIAAVAGLGLAVASASVWTAGASRESAGDVEFVRRGGFHATLPDATRRGWYVRVKVNPDGSSEVTKRLSEAEFLKQVDLDAEVRRRIGMPQAATPPGVAPAVSPDMIGRIDGVAGAFRRRS